MKFGVAVAALSASHAIQGKFAMNSLIGGSEMCNTLTSDSFSTSIACPDIIKTQIPEGCTNSDVFLGMKASTDNCDISSIKITDFNIKYRDVGKSLLRSLSISKTASELLIVDPKCRLQVLLTGLQLFKNKNHSDGYSDIQTGLSNESIDTENQNNIKLVDISSIILKPGFLKKTSEVVTVLDNLSPFALGASNLIRLESALRVYASENVNSAKLLKDIYILPFTSKLFETDHNLFSSLKKDAQLKCKGLKQKPLNSLPFFFLGSTVLTHENEELTTYPSEISSNNAQKSKTSIQNHGGFLASFLSTVSGSLGIADNAPNESYTPSLSMVETADSLLSSEFMVRSQMRNSLVDAIRAEQDNGLLPWNCLSSEEIELITATNGGCQDPDTIETCVINNSKFVKTASLKPLEHSKKKTTTPTNEYNEDDSVETIVTAAENDGEEDSVSFLPKKQKQEKKDASVMVSSKKSASLKSKNLENGKAEVQHRPIVNEADFQGVDHFSNYQLDDTPPGMKVSFSEFTIDDLTQPQKRRQVFLNRLYSAVDLDDERTSMMDDSNDQTFIQDNDDNIVSDEEIDKDTSLNSNEKAAKKEEMKKLREAEQNKHEDKKEGINDKDAISQDNGTKEPEMTDEEAQQIELQRAMEEGMKLSENDSAELKEKKDAAGEKAIEKDNKAIEEKKKDDEMLAEKQEEAETKAEAIDEEAYEKMQKEKEKENAEADDPSKPKKTEDEKAPKNPKHVSTDDNSFDSSKKKTSYPVEATPQRESDSGVGDDIVEEKNGLLMSEFKRGNVRVVAHAEGADEDSRLIGEKKEKVMNDAMQWIDKYQHELKELEVAALATETHHTHRVKEGVGLTVDVLYNDKKATWEAIQSIAYTDKDRAERKKIQDILTNKTKSKPHEKHSADNHTHPDDMKGANTKKRPRDSSEPAGKSYSKNTGERKHDENESESGAPPKEKLMKFSDSPVSEGK